MNVQIPMSKGACIAFECLREACIWLRSSGIWPSLIIRLHESTEAAFSRRKYCCLGEEGSAEVLRHSGFVILSSFVIRVSSFKLWFRH